jgi:prolyl-tRNA synthetase
MPETKAKKHEDFNEWYNEIVELADLCDKRYPIKGMNIWRPYGWTLMQNVDHLIRQEMINTNHQEVNFPLLIPETYFKKEEEHIEGFGSEVYWITHAGTNPLDERWLLRPTSETAMYPIFSLWIRSHTDLPLKTFQIVNTFRYETKQTRAFIRVREIHFFEAHTCHTTFEDAEKQINENKKIAEKLLEKLSLPYLLSKRPNWDKFAGAYYTISIDVLMPSLRTLQIGSIHQYRDNFAKPYEITYETEQGDHAFCHQTTYGMSERLLGAIVGIHGDNKGLVLPPDIAPIQVIIIPIIFKGKEKSVNEACQNLEEKLKKHNIRVKQDKRDITPGNKYYDWELKGVPLRIEIGPRDVENNQYTIVRRDTSEKSTITHKQAEATIIKTLQNIQENLHTQANNLITEYMHRVDTLDEATSLQGIIELPWCGIEECALEIETILEGNTLGEPIEKQNCESKCPHCGKKGVSWMRYAKSY